MTSFDELRLGPEIVAALAAEGIETPTPFQAAAIPVIARGNDLLGRVGAGGGAMVAYAAPLLGRVDAGGDGPVGLVVCAGQRQATRLARSLAPLCEATGHRAAALGRPWREPERADFLFVPADGIRKLFDGGVSTERVRAVVLHDGDAVLAAVPEDHVEALLSGLPDDCQRIFCGLPFGPTLQSVARRFTRRAATVPSPARDEQGGRKGGGAPRGRRVGQPSGTRALHCVVAHGGRMEATLALAAELLEGPVDHVLVFASSADQAADLGDFLEVHGFAAGPPGDEHAPVWLSPDEDGAAREALEAAPNPRAVATVSAAAPPAAEAVAHRHEIGGPAWVIAETRELRHLEIAAREAGFALRRVRPRRETRVTEAVDALAEELAEAARSPETAPYALLVEALAGELGPTEIAAAALALLHRQRADEGRPAAEGAPTAWVRLFLSCGEHDEIGPREIVGAIASEAGVAGEQIGKIQVRDRHAVVEVAEPEAAKVVKALNGITLGGRSLRVDYDRPRERRPARQARDASGRRRGKSPDAKPAAEKRPKSWRPGTKESAGRQSPSRRPKGASGKRSPSTQPRTKRTAGKRSGAKKAGTGLPGGKRTFEKKARKPPAKSPG